ncbi:cyclin-dependent kinase 12-like isoform X2 [Sphaeramia orbicularis]|uniref:cyclin-dependent kinase 12-like isoform X2 n=1 Tax=Sphaeramia orbicularis TaxID=375764 RepID=UPI00117FDDA9|nr:cyclin-dependent kinase 12-like isoform X2 [Sphaeramia orbicularis]
MMYSNRSEYGHRRQHSDRDSRPWDNYDDRREERRESQRDIRRDSYEKYDKYGGDGHSRTQGMSRSREYSDSPKRPYSKDLKRGRSRKSPVRRGMSSTDWSVPEKKRRTFSEEEDDLYRYKREPEDEPYRQSPDKFSHKHRAKDYKHTPPQEEEFRYRKTPQESRYSLRHEEFPSKPRPDDSTYRRTSGYYTDRDGGDRSQDHSREREQSQDHSMKRYGQPQERSDSFSTDYEDHRQNRTRVPLSSSSGQTFEHHVIRKTGKSPLPEPKKPAKGFQRFLDVLNKGVNFNVLTKIVNQTHTEADDRPRSPASFQSAEDRPWSPSGSTWRQQGGHKNTEYWNETDESVRRVSPRPHHRSFSPNRCDASDEKATQTRGEGRSYFSLNRRSLSPLGSEKTTLTPEDEHKHRQMQDVLQAIGMNLGFDELGQMSHRIQERLYGKKDSDRGRDCKESRETKRSQAFSPRRRSRSSSSQSSFSPASQNYYRRSNSHSIPREETEPDQHVEYSHQSSSSVQDSERSETYSKENTGAYQTFNPNPSNTVSEPPLMPASPVVGYTPLPYAALSPNVPPTGPQFFLPQLPPFLHYPPIPPMNIFPAVLAQTRQLVYPHISNHSPSLLRLPDLHPPQPLSTVQKSKPMARPRCLQVIETKQPG